jgi:hypothetical protein
MEPTGCRCAIGRHGKRKRMESEVASGTPVRIVATKYHVSEDALQRHKLLHMGLPKVAKPAKAAKPPVVPGLDAAEIEELTAPEPEAVPETPAPVLATPAVEPDLETRPGIRGEYLRWYMRVLRLFELAEGHKNVQQMLAAMREGKDLLEKSARLQGFLVPDATFTFNNNFTAQQRNSIQVFDKMTAEQLEDFLAGRPVDLPLKIAK